jgi:hypothetical protein
MSRWLLHDTVVQGDSKIGLCYYCTYELFRIFVSMVYVSGINCEVCQILVIGLAGGKARFFKNVSVLISFTTKRTAMQVILKTAGFPSHLDTHLT